MCGITCIFNIDQTPLDFVDHIERMTSALAHRGPDSWGTYIGKSVALGHTRLSIIDLSTGDQPMSDTEAVISYNGEVYNYIELREELTRMGVVFNTQSDTEVVLKAYEAWGKDAFTRFNGQFAVLIWDKKNKQLVAARDRYGVRPLFITKWHGVWCFASEMKAFDVLPGFRREYDIEHLFEHGLLWNTIGSDTVYKDIRIVAPGTLEIYTNSSEPRIYRYYSLGFTHQKVEVPFKEAEEELREMLLDSVRLRLRSDVPVGMYLSGGIDSSVLALLTSQIMKERFKSFSVTFGDKDFDESVYQNEMVRHINSEHHSVQIDYDTVSDNFSDAVYHAERPLFRTAPVPLFLLSQLVRANDMKVVITGEASDEVLFGYDSYKEVKLLEFWKQYPNSKLRPLLIKNLYPHLRHYADSRAYGLMKLYYEDFLSAFPNELAGLIIRIKNNSILAAAFNKGFGIKYESESLIEKIKTIFPPEYNTWSLLQKNQFLEMATLLDGYLLSSQGDRMALGHGIEGRLPFLDHRFIEKIFSWPDSFKLKGFSQKHILRRAFKGLIPDSIINRPKLPYQAPDLKSFIRNGKPIPLVEQFMSPGMIRDYGVFDEKFVARFLMKFAKRAPEQIGYRDNMMLVFILSAQIALFWARNPRKILLNDKTRSVNIFDQN